MSASLSENDLSNSNGLTSDNECAMNTSEEKGDSIEDVENDSSLFTALELEPYLFEQVAAIDKSGQKVPWKKTKERRVKTG